MQRSAFLLSKIATFRLGCPITDVKDTGKVCRTDAEKRLGHNTRVPCFS